MKSNRFSIARDWKSKREMSFSAAFFSRSTFTIILRFLNWRRCTLCLVVAALVNCFSFPHAFHLWEASRAIFPPQSNCIATIQRETREISYAPYVVTYTSASIHTRQRATVWSEATTSKIHWFKPFSFDYSFLAIFFGAKSDGISSSMDVFVCASAVSSSSTSN